MQNDPTTLWAAGLSHTRADPAFPSRYLERGFYHLAYLLTSESQRREKVAHYLGIADVHRIPSSDRDMAEFYMPEEVPGTRPVSVPRADRKAIAAVLEATGPGLPTPPTLYVPLAVRAEIDAGWPERTMSAAAYEAKLQILDRVVHLAPGEHRPVHVRFTNDGGETWPQASREDGWPYPSERRPQIRLSYRWYRPNGQPQGGEGFRTDLPAAVPPGATTVVPVLVAAPDEPGSYLLEFDLVHEFVRWFEQPARTEASVGETGGPGLSPGSPSAPDGRPGSEVCRGAAPVPGGRGRDVVAVDSRLGDERLGLYESVADTVVLYEFGSFVEQSLEWLASLCSGDWIFRLDGDEVASPALIAALPRLTEADDAVQYWIPCRWVHPDGRRWFDEWPWWPDFSNRLVRNDERLHFDGVAHSGAATALPARYVEEPFYHLLCALAPKPERERKVAEYFELDPTLKAEGSDRLLRHFYLPEDHATLEPAAIPVDDLRRVEARSGPATGPRLPRRKRSGCSNGGRSTASGRGDQCWTPRIGRRSSPCRHTGGCGQAIIDRFASVFATKETRAGQADTIANR